MEISLRSSFTAFDLTREEERSGYTFHAANKAVIQNLISSAAEELVRMSLRVSELTKEEILKIEYSRGQIDILKYLLETGDILKAEADQEILDAQSKDSNQEI